MTTASASPAPRLPISPGVERLRQSYKEAVGQRRARGLIGAAILAACIVVSALVGEVRPGVLLENGWRFTDYIHRIMPVLRWDSLGADLAEWQWGFFHWLRLMGETLLIAYLGTIIGAVVGFVLCFLAANNLGRGPVVRFTARRFLEFCRTVPELVFALIFVIAFGLGPLPGVLALGIHTAGALGKLFSEVVENIDMKPVEGVAAAGGNFAQTVRFAVVPQVLSNFASYTLLRFEINVRGAAIMGFVGAGGIGQDLLEAVRKFYYSDVSAILVLILVTVMIIDLATERLRHVILGREEAH